MPVLAHREACIVHKAILVYSVIPRDPSGVITAKILKTNILVHSAPVDSPHQENFQLLNLHRPQNTVHKITYVFLAL